MARLLKQRGIDATEVDVINVDLPDQNILDDSTWQRMLKDINSGVYQFLFASPPCRTFSEFRSEPGGPPVLRDHDWPYGYPKSQAYYRGLSRSDFDKLREDNLLADRVAQACSGIAAQGGVYAVEQPHPWKGSVRMFDLESFVRLLQSGAQVVLFDQCMYGQRTTKPTEVLYWLAGFDKLQARCNHKERHAPVVGLTDEAGVYLTKRLAAYPALLNKSIVGIIAEALEQNHSD